MACRTFFSSTKIVIQVLFQAALLAFAPRPATAQAFDATNLRQPAEIGTVGVVQAGDNPAYAQPDFDDSKWLPVDAKTLPGDYFPHAARCGRRRQKQSPAKSQMPSIMAIRPGARA